MPKVRIKVREWGCKEGYDFFIYIGSRVDKNTELGLIDVCWGLWTFSKKSDKKIYYYFISNIRKFEKIDAKEIDVRAWGGGGKIAYIDK